MVDAGARCKLTRRNHEILHASQDLPLVPYWWYAKKKIQFRKVVSQRATAIMTDNICIQQVLTMRAFSCLVM